MPEIRGKALTTLSLLRSNPYDVWPETVQKWIERAPMVDVMRMMALAEPTRHNIFISQFLQEATVSQILGWISEEAAEAKAPAEGTGTTPAGDPPEATTAQVGGCNHVQ
jgi:hypothetical protein